ncbi:MAG: C_GCAxxG_C_C family protein [Ruminococcus sp.]|nr:C_GCAxxG_C_C family protein [Ruminococcus sp.]
MKNHGQIAEELFYEGYNCSQAVLIAFEDMTGLDRKTAAMLASSFGGGLGRMREVCGAVSGASMVLGLLKGYSDPKSREAKVAHYQLIRDFAARFKEKNGSIICRDLLGGVASTGGTPEERTPEFYQKRPCAALIRQAADILDEMLSQTDAS